MKSSAAPRTKVVRTVALRLYIAGDGPNSLEARANVQTFLARPLEREVTLEIVDVLVHPEQGLSAGIIVTPTLVRVRPLPEQRIVGNMRGREALFSQLIRGGESDD